MHTHGHLGLGGVALGDDLGDEGGVGFLCSANPIDCLQKMAGITNPTNRISQLLNRYSLSLCHNATSGPASVNRSRAAFHDGEQGDVGAGPPSA